MTDDDALAALDPACYIARLGVRPFEWQEFILRLPPGPILLLATRQAGKSTVIAGRTLARRMPLSLVIADTENHAKNLMRKVRDMMIFDKSISAIDPDATFEVGIVRGSSLCRVKALPGTEQSVRSESAPGVLLIDEAAKVADETYMAARPMRAGVEDGDLIALTSAAWKRGWFYKAWTQSKAWTKVLVRPAWDMTDGFQFVPAIPEDRFRKECEESGIYGFYSPRHTREFLQGEIEEYMRQGRGLWWFRQEYFCEFQEVEDLALAPEMLARAWQDGGGRRFGGDTAISEGEGRRIG